MSPSRAGSAARTLSYRIARGLHRFAGDPPVGSMALQAVMKGDEILDEPGGVSQSAGFFSFDPAYD